MIDYSCFSSAGSYPCNEDSFKILDLGRRKCFILADGLGGHGKGEVASSAAVNYAGEFLSKCKFISKTVLQNCFNTVHQQIHILQQSDRKLMDMKTTLVILVIEDDIAYWGHIGDSRLYSFGVLGISEHTKDHSVPQMMVTMGEMKEKDIRKSPERNRLLAAIGVDDETVHAEIHSKAVKIKKGTGFMLCSDGFWELVTEKKMEHYFRFSSNAEVWLKKMTDCVRENGQNKKMDNYTAVTVMIK